MIRSRSCDDLRSPRAAVSRTQSLLSSADDFDNDSLALIPPEYRKNSTMNIFSTLDRRVLTEEINIVALCYTVLMSDQTVCLFMHTIGPPCFIVDDGISYSYFVHFSFTAVRKGSTSVQVAKSLNLKGFHLHLSRFAPRKAGIFLGNTAQNACQCLI